MEISADLREAVAHQRRVRDDELYKWPRLLYFYFTINCYHYDRYVKEERHCAKVCVSVTK